MATSSFASASVLIPYSLGSAPSLLDARPPPFFPHPRVCEAAAPAARLPQCMPARCCAYGAWSSFTLTRWPWRCVVHACRRHVQATAAGSRRAPHSSRKATGRNPASLHNLNAMVLGVAHNDAPVAVDANAANRISELSLPATLAADGADVRTVRVIQHLHARINMLKHNQMTGARARARDGAATLFV